MSSYTERAKKVQAMLEELIPSDNALDSHSTVHYTSPMGRKLSIEFKCGCPFDPADW